MMQITGLLLRMERIKQNKGQKEICHGICVPSYLSKIEHGTVKTNEKIIQELFLRLGIKYEMDSNVLTSKKKIINQYFYNLKYDLGTAEIYQELKMESKELHYSELTIDWLLIQGLEGEAVEKQLESLVTGMSQEQKAYFCIVKYYILLKVVSKNKEEDQKVKHQMYLACREAYEILGNAYAMMQLCTVYMIMGDYSKIHQMENRAVAVAVEEGNTYYLAHYYFINGSAYACLNMEEMMMSCYERSIQLLQNTNWNKELSTLYYNIGATYISLKKYDLALEYLDKVEYKNFSVLQKKSIALIRNGKKNEAKEFLDLAKNCLVKGLKVLPSDWLKYKEACFECEDNFLDNPKYLELLEELMKAIEKELHFGHLFFYKDMIIEAYTRQRKYKKALNFEKKISSGIRK